MFKFDPIAELSLETVFVTIPSLCLLEKPQLSEVKQILSKTW